jgi:hypothetical protein
MRMPEDGSSGAPRPLVALAVALVMTVGAGACAHVAGKSATTGALEKLNEEAAASGTGERPSELIAGRTVDAAIAHLGDPQQIALLRRVVAQTSAQAGQSLTTAIGQQLAADLGARAEGPLGASITAVSEQAAVAGARGVVRLFAPACATGDSACLDRRVMELSRQAGTGFMAGVRKEVGLAALLLSFLAGVTSAVVVTLAVQTRRSYGRPRRARLPASPGPLAHPQPT